MTEEEKQLLAEYTQAMPAAGYAYAKILYKNAPIEELTSLSKIESVVRSQMQEHVMPSVGVFLPLNLTGESKGHKREIKSIIGKLTVTSSQAKKLELRPHSQLSPQLIVVLV